MQNTKVRKKQKTFPRNLKKLKCSIIRSKNIERSQHGGIRFFFSDQVNLKTKHGYYMVCKT